MRQYSKEDVPLLSDSPNYGRERKLERTVIRTQACSRAKTYKAQSCLKLNERGGCIVCNNGTAGREGEGGGAVTDEVSDTIGGDERCRNVLIRIYIVAYWLANSTRLSCGVYAQTY